LTNVKRKSLSPLVDIYLNSTQWPYYRGLHSADLSPALIRVLEELARSPDAAEYFEAAIRTREQFNLFALKLPKLRKLEEQLIEQLLSQPAALKPEYYQKAVDTFVLREFFHFLHRPVNLYLIGETAFAQQLHTERVNKLHSIYQIGIEQTLEMLNDALARAPGSRALLFRGHSNDLRLYEKLKEGDVLIEKGFLSTSVNLQGVYSKDVMFVILAKNAKFGLNTGEVAEAVLNRASSELSGNFPLRA